VVAAILLAGGLLLARGLDTAANYDEGVYLASLDALRHGQTLGSDVFASQPPGFYLLLRLVSFVFGSSVEDVRHGFLALALVGYGAAYALGRALSGVAAATAAAGLLVIAPVVGDEGARIAADVPAISLALVSLALAAFGLRRGSAVLALLSGAAFAAAVSVKLLALPAIVPLVGLAFLLRARRREILLLVAGAAAVALVLIGAYAGVLGDLWHESVGFHNGARQIPGLTFRGNVHLVRHSLDFHTPFGWLIPLGALAAIVAARRGSVSWPLWAWVAASAAFLVVQYPLLGHHFVLIEAAFATAAGTSLGALAARWPLRVQLVAAAVLLLAIAAGYAQERRRLGRNDTPEPPAVLRAASTLGMVTQPGDRAVTDLPIVAYLAHRQTPGRLVDTSFVRFASHSLTPAQVLRATEERSVKAIVVGRELQNYPDLLAAFRRRFPERRRLGGVTVYSLRSP
jgi:4-amino-4-deoxy-L-arabinose transferase-like glycosyltransferase